MSYTNLILQDSPISVWNLSEESGSIAYNDNFLGDSLYNGKYLPILDLWWKIIAIFRYNEQSDGK